MVQSFFGGDTGVSYDELQRRKKYADQMVMRGASRPARNVSEGINSAANSILGALLARKAGKEESAQREEFGTLFADLLGGGTSFNPSVGSRGAAPSSYGGGGVPDTPSFGPTDTAYPVGDDGPVPNEQVTAGGTTFDMGRPDMSQYRDAIASIESAGSGDYGAVGPTNERLGRALGRYQIMEANIGPWSREALGREVTPEEFLRNPGLQDAIFDHKFGGYVNQFGPEGAAQAWFAGPGGVGKTDRRDVLGTSVGEYGQKFAQALGSPTVSTQGSYQAPQGFSNGFDPRLVQALSNPYATDGQRAVLSALLQRQMSANQPMSPMEQLQFQKAQLELERMQNPQSEPVFQDGQWWDLSSGTPQPLTDPRDEVDTVVVGDKLVNRQTGEVVYADEQGSGIDAKAESDLRKEYAGLPATKDFSLQSQAYGRIVESASDPSPAGDLALIFNYMKVLDPGSVVRESEFATAQNAAAVPDRVRNMYNRVMEGERLNPEQRRDFVRRATKLYKEAERGEAQRYGQYSTIARDYGYEPDRVLPDFRYTQQGAPTASARPRTAPGRTNEQAQPNSVDFSSMSAAEIREYIKVNPVDNWTPEMRDAAGTRLRNLQENR